MHPRERLQSEARVPPVADLTTCEATRVSRPQGQLRQAKDEAPCWTGLPIGWEADSNGRSLPRTRPKRG